MDLQEFLTKPRRVADAQLDRNPESVLVCRQGHPAVALNPTALALWELCDGETHVDEMVEAVCVLFAVPSEQARQDVAFGLAQMQRAGVIT